MQAFAAMCIRRPVFASMFMLALVVAGAAAVGRLGVDRFPSLDMPIVVVQTELPGASAEEIETQITERVEEAVNTIAGIEELTSISAPGRSVVRILFELDHDIDVAAQDVRDRVATILRDLPPQAELPLVAKLDNEQSAVLEIALYGERSIRELTELADKTLKRQLERVAGVGEVSVDWPPTRSRSRPSATPSAGRTPISPAATSPRGITSRRCARWGASRILSVSTIWSSPPGPARPSGSATSAGPRMAPRSSARSLG